MKGFGAVFQDKHVLADADEIKFLKIHFKRFRLDETAAFQNNYTLWDQITAGAQQARPS